MNNNINILGVRIDNFACREIKEKISDILQNPPERTFVTTLNPEILLKAHNDEYYRNILNGANLNLCDGFGIKLVSFFKGNYIKGRFAGADLVDFLLEKANVKKLNVLVMVAENSLSSAEEIERVTRQKYPDLRLKSEYFSPSQVVPENAIIKQADIVFVSFGAPDQEIFIHENRVNFPNAKVLIGVGGTFDFFTGKFRRAPKWMRKIGMEWLWRLTREPKRMRRIINAVIVFPAVAMAKKI